jgi:hypothetical protein
MKALHFEIADDFSRSLRVLQRVLNQNPLMSRFIIRLRAQGTRNVDCPFRNRESTFARRLAQPGSNISIASPLRRARLIQLRALGSFNSSARVIKLHGREFTEDK